jgi:hypothetical protein
MSADRRLSPPDPGPAGHAGRGRRWHQQDIASGLSIGSRARLTRPTNNSGNPAQAPTCGGNLPAASGAVAGCVRPGQARVVHGLVHTHVLVVHALVHGVVHAGQTPSSRPDRPEPHRRPLTAATARAAIDWAVGAIYATT